MSVKVFVEVVTALLFSASNLGLSVALLFKLLKFELLSFNLSTSGPLLNSIDLSAIPGVKSYAKYCSL